MRVRGAAPILAALALTSSCATSGLSAEEIKDQLASSDPQARRALARDPQMSPDTLATLSKDPDDLVRVYVAENPGTRPQTIKAMSEDKALIVIDALSRSPKTPPERLAALAKQFRGETRGHVFWQQLIDNPSTPVEVRLDLQGKVTAEEDQAAGGGPVAPELLKAFRGTWLFEIGPWTRLEVSDGLRDNLIGGRAQALISPVKAERYSLTLTESRAAKLEWPGGEAMIGGWSAPDGQLRVELRQRGPVSWRLEGATPAAGRIAAVLETRTGYRSRLRTSNLTGRPPSSAPAPAEAIDTARWSIELRRSP